MARPTTPVKRQKAVQTVVPLDLYTSLVQSSAASHMPLGSFLRHLLLTHVPLTPEHG